MKKTLFLSPILEGDNNTLKAFPQFVSSPQKAEVSPIKSVYYRILLFLFRCFVIVSLRAYKKSYRKFHRKSYLTNEDVEEIYTREADNYESRHHFTTHYRDTWWRREVGFIVAGYANVLERKISLLDIGTGVGLSLEEMFRIFDLFNVEIIAIGLDYNSKMLEKANLVTLNRMRSENLIKEGSRELEFVRGDAHTLTNSKSENLVSFSENHFDITTNIFSLGGMEKPVKALTEQLRVLKEGGLLIILDIHRPVTHISEHWPMYIGRKDGVYFTLCAWDTIVKPFILKTVWGWHDISSLFYISKYCSYLDPYTGSYYGFEQISFVLVNENWWFGIPAMTTARVILKKKKIDPKEHEENSKILTNISF